MKKLVLFVEGDGESTAAPALVKRLLTELGAWGTVQLDPAPFVVGQVNNLYKSNHQDWIRWLRAAVKRQNVGAILLLLDGDVSMVNRRAFCAATVAKELADASRQAGGGALFSVACVFACQEYESWFIAGIESLAGKSFPDGRPGVKAGAVAPPGDLEQLPRNAKGWMSKNMNAAYSPTKDQRFLTEMVDLDEIRQRPMRSFRRLESALKTVVNAIATDAPVVSPQ